MSVKWEEFLPRITPSVKGCPVSIIFKALRDATREFCKKTWIWQELVDYEVEEDSSDVFIYVPRDSRLVAVRYLLEDGNRIQVKSNYYVRSDRELTQSEFDQIEDKECKARVVLKPSETSEYCPDFLLNDHSEIICYGAKFRLMYDPSKEWANPQLALASMQMFNKGIAAERINLKKGYVERSLQVKPRRFI